LDRLREEIVSADVTLNRLLGIGRECENGH
jgi:hypothetical protein